MLAYFTSGMCHDSEVGQPGNINGRKLHCLLSTFFFYAIGNEWIIKYSTGVLKSF